MKKKEAREKAINYLYNASCAFYDISSKQVVDDMGTLSESGYTDEECEIIQKELDFIIKRVLQLNFLKPTQHD